MKITQKSKREISPYSTDAKSATYGITQNIQLSKNCQSDITNEKVLLEYKKLKEGKCVDNGRN